MNETPEAAVCRLAAQELRHGFILEALHAYRDATNNIVYYRIRLKHPDGRKWIRPMYLNGQGYEIGEPEFTNGKPLYRLPELAARSSNPVWFPEGENKVDALQRLGVLATTSGGSTSAKHADFSPLANRCVIIWPDNDEPGLRHAQEVADTLVALGATVRLVDIGQLNLPLKGDVVDWLNAHPNATSADLDRLPLIDYITLAIESADAPDVRCIEVADFLELELPPRDYILMPWLPTQGLAMVHAPRGVGKTHVALGVAFAVASGDTFLRWTAPQARGVLFIDGEMPARTLQERLAYIVAAADKEPAAPLRIITPDLQPEGMPDLSCVDGQTAISAYLDNIDLIIVDNISTLCRTGKENESESWLSMQGWALQQRARGRSVLFVHHSGKGGAQRGTSRREDVLDSVINLRRPSDYKAEDGAAFEIHYEKSRGFYGDDAAPFEAQLITDEHNHQCWAMSSLEDSTFERVVRLLNDGLSQIDIVAELHLAKSTVSHHAKRAKAEERLKQNA